MASEYVDFLRPRDFGRLNGASVNEVDMVPRNSALGIRLLKSDSAGFSALAQIPGSLTISTGLTLAIGLVDDGADSNDPGKVIRVGVTVKKIAGGTDSYDIATNAGTEQTVDVTLNSTAGVAVQGSLAITNANLDSAGAGDTILIRLRRLGTASADTLVGPAILTFVGVKNT
jgi:hypothetical protein